MDNDTTKSGVYIIRNLITGAVYVGSTIQTFKHRWQAHKRDEEIRGLAKRFKKAQSRELVHSIKNMQSAMNAASDRMIDQMIAEWEASGTEFAKQRIEELKTLKTINEFETE